MSDELTVFIVDDDEPVRDAIGMLLDTVDIPYRGYGDAQAFLEDFDSAQTGCLVLDIRMPGMSGIEEHGGNLDFENNDTHGCTFYFQLPRTQRCTPRQA